MADGLVLDVFDAECQASVEGDGEDSQAEVSGDALYPCYIRQFVDRNS
jgi:hypothetical protein